MKRRKKFFLAHKAPFLLLLLLINILFILSELDNNNINSLKSSIFVSSMLLLKTNCLTNAPSCECLWKNGKFIADCSRQNLKQVPINDYVDNLLSNAAGNNQMQTLNRDLQQLNLASNNITHLFRGEFFDKKFNNLQKIFLNSNNIVRVDLKAFRKLIGLVELDLSENFISRFDEIVSNNGEEDDDDDDYDDSHNKIENLTSDNNNSNKYVEHKNNQNFIKSKSSPLYSKYKIDNKTVIHRRTFLQHLTQLRQLNLASNLLVRVEAFTFSPLIQLRHLDLSR